MYPWEDPKELHWFILTQREKRFLITDEHLIFKGRRMASKLGP